jgi:cytochrome P450
MSCRILFGGQLDEGQAAELGEKFADYQTALEQMDINTLFGLPSWLPGIKPNKSAKAAKIIHDMVDKLIVDGKDSHDKNTVLAQFLAEGLSREQIRNELITLFMAGHETVANTLAWAWYLISQCPEVEQRLHDEIDSVLGKRMAVFADVAQLNYTRAIIEETLRLYPPLPILSREAIAEDSIRKRHIPVGSTVLVVPWLLHRHKHYWDKPDHFIPERFLPDALTTQDRFAYIPFGVGPRACVAKEFALVQISLCLALLARHFRLHVPTGHTVTHECRLTLRPKDNLLMQITAR